MTKEVSSDGGGDGRPWDDGVVDVSPEDEAALAAFAAEDDAAKGTRSLADVILEKVRAVAARRGRGEGGSSGRGSVRRRRRRRARSNSNSSTTRRDLNRHAKPAPDPSRRSTSASRRSTAASAASSPATRRAACPRPSRSMPSLRNWEDILYLTDPSSWSPHATFQATRLFVSSLNARLAQRFLALVLLPAVRRDIQAEQQAALRSVPSDAQGGLQARRLL